MVEDPNADYLALSTDFIYDAISIRRNLSYSMYQNLQTEGDLIINTSIIEGSKSVVKITSLSIFEDQGYTISINLLESSSPGLFELEELVPKTLIFTTKVKQAIQMPVSRRLFPGNFMDFSVENTDIDLRHIYSWPETLIKSLSINFKDKVYPVGPSGEVVLVQNETALTRFDCTDILKVDFQCIRIDEYSFSGADRFELAYSTQMDDPT